MDEHRYPDGRAAARRARRASDGRSHRPAAHLPACVHARRQRRIPRDRVAAGSDQPRRIPCRRHPRGEAAERHPDRRGRSRLQRPYAAWCRRRRRPCADPEHRRPRAARRQLRCRLFGQRHLRPLAGRHPHGSLRNALRFRVHADAQGVHAGRDPHGASRSDLAARDLFRRWGPFTARIPGHGVAAVRDHPRAAAAGRGLPYRADRQVASRRQPGLPRLRTRLPRVAVAAAWWLHVSAGGRPARGQRPLRHRPDRPIYLGGGALGCALQRWRGVPARPLPHRLPHRSCGARD